MSYFKYIISKKEQGMTLKIWMQSFYLAKNKINYLIDQKLVMINDKISYNREQILNENDIVVVDTSIYDTIDYPPYRFNLKILYEDEYLLVVDKPKGVIIYPENKELDKTMANFIAYYYIKTNQSYAVRHVHRLDCDTTGCLLYAKDIFTHSKLSNYFENNKTKKEYFALVYGIIENDGVINQKIGRNRHANKMMITPSGSDALTYYYPEKILNKKTLVKVLLKTGRTHQIRVHLASISHPLLGDKLYGKEDNYQRVMLHCFHLGFIHPITGLWFDVYAETPADMNEIINKNLNNKE